MSVSPVLIDALARGWARLRLAAAAPERVPVWDVLLLTAAGPLQASLYRSRLEELQAKGLLPASTRCLVVEDPEGQRIGSGGATLNALRAATDQLGDLSGQRVVMVHAGGDSKRLPWAGILGKAFLPLPLLADADEPAPTLLEQLLALASPLPATITGGGCWILTGDCLPMGDLSACAPLHDEAGLLVTPVTLDIAARHGVVAASDEGVVERLHQKLSPDELRAVGAVDTNGRALLDTGVVGVAGIPWRGLLKAANAADDPVAQLIAQRAECSLYEEIFSVWVPERHAWLRDQPLGPELIAAGGGSAMKALRCEPLAFVHLGTTAEAMAHLDDSWHGRLTRRVLSSGGSDAAATATVLESRLDPGARVGAGALVVSSHLGSRVRIGSRAAAIALVASDAALVIPDNIAVWQLPLADGSCCTAVCGADDDPKQSFERGTLVQESWASWCRARDVAAEEIWPHVADPGQRSGWNARIFPATDPATGLALVPWLTGVDADRILRERWRSVPRQSLADLAHAVDAAALAEHLRRIRGEVALAALHEALDAACDRPANRLAAALPPAQRQGLCLSLAARVPAPGTPAALGAPASRLLQARADLLQVAGDQEAAAAAHGEAHQALAREVAQAVASAGGAAQGESVPSVAALVAGSVCEEALPARIDLAGGWTDTPPWCLGEPAAVLNLTVHLDGRPVVGCRVEATDERCWQLSDDRGHAVTITSATCSSDPSDPFRLATAALMTCGYAEPAADGAHARPVVQGVRLKTWSTAPRGSGLGASSVLAAAVVRALLRLSDRPHDDATVGDLVLKVESAMGSGGGWQDQYGGLVPGVKLVRSRPTQPLGITVEPIPLAAALRSELERRLVLVFTGQERLAFDVLGKVVTKLRRRDGRLSAIMRELTSLAEAGHSALAYGDLDELGRVMAAAWRCNQELDPHCSNPAVDALLAPLADHCSGWKLAGAGGGGFAALMAKDVTAAEAIRAHLAEVGSGVYVCPWTVDASAPVTVDSQ